MNSEDRSAAQQDIVPDEKGQEQPADKARGNTSAVKIGTTNRPAIRVRGGGSMPSVSCLTCVQCPHCGRLARDGRGIRLASAQGCRRSGSSRKRVRGSLLGWG